MGDHVCGGPSEPSGPPPPASFDQFMSYNNNNTKTSSSNNINAREQERTGRLPPQVDTSAANRSYYRPGQLTPVSNSSGSQSVSPKTPLGLRNGAGSRGPADEDYFAPRIAGEFDSPSSSSSQQRRPGGYGGLTGGGGVVDDLDAYPPPANDPKKAVAAGQSLLQRMNTIAPGPFNVLDRKLSSGSSNSNSNSNSNNTRNAFSSAQDGINNGNRKGSNASGEERYGQSQGRYGSPNSRRNNNNYYDDGGDKDLDFDPPTFNRAGTFPRLSESNNDAPSRTPSAPGARPDRRQQRQQPPPSNMYDYGTSGGNGGSYGSYGNMAAPPPPRMPPSTVDERQRRPSMGPDTSRPPPPRTSLLRPRTAGRDNNAPPINLAAEFGIGNPYHSPSASMSSTVSSLSRPSVPFSSSASSLSSATSFSTASSSNSALDRNRPKMNNSNNNNLSSFDSLMDNLQAMNVMDDRDLSPPRQQRQQQQAGSLRVARRPSQTDRNRNNSTYNNFNSNNNNNGGYGGFGASSGRPRSPLISPGWSNSYSSNNDTNPNTTYDDDGGRQRGRDNSGLPSPTVSSLRSRTSPEGRRPASRGRSGVRNDPNDGGYRADRNNYNNGSLRSRERSRARDPSVGSRSRTAAAAAAAAAGSPSPPPRIPTQSRGDCKACGLPITSGKSVSSADGRLMTGRYHKACFVCTTCAAPFASATFYVHDNQPYCERHYHAVNGSLCGRCGNGIEGPYLADEADCKYHPTCFVCTDCARPLEDGYFEVAGNVYCERDAWKRVQSTWLAGGGGGGSGMGIGGGIGSGIGGSAVPSPTTPQMRSNNMNSGNSNGLLGVPRGVPSGLPSGPAASRRPSTNGGTSMGTPSYLPAIGGGGGGQPARPFGLPSGNRLGPKPRMEKRMTRLGMMT
ncbi:lim domain containing protein [Niveomyces insectorum RCEF 264]|uniref:Lim domain containing protein n=1 Tax=Niveomyces insectorum RCEF 264 TaxID=1081102 RepID=A0A168AB18_9HYPO|nr:lim domain containing protein [Niveomyces insectorum RCEF 264]